MSLPSYLFFKKIFLTFIFKFYLFSFCLCWILVAVCWLSLCVTSGGYSLVVMQELLDGVTSLLVKYKLWTTRASVVATCRLNSCGKGLVARQHVGSSWAHDQIHVSCTSKQILPATGRPGKTRPFLLYSWNLDLNRSPGPSIWVLRHMWAPEAVIETKASFRVLFYRTTAATPGTVDWIVFSPKLI